MSAERWIDILGYESLYQISSNGRVRRLKGYMCVKHRLLKLQRWGQYPCVELCKNGLRRTHNIHDLMLTSFFGPRPPDMICRHLDGDPTNNEIDNLIWGTQSANLIDSMQHGTRFQPDNRGQRQWKAKLTDTDVIAIKKLLISGISQRQIAQQFNVHPTTISCIAVGKTWRHI